MNTKNLKTFSNLLESKYFIWVALIFIIILSNIIFYFFPPEAYDWIVTFYPVSKIPLQPYAENTFMNAPWTAIALFPFSFLPLRLSLTMNASINFAVFWLLIRKNNGRLLTTLLVFTSSPFLSSIANGTIEWLPAIGFLLPNYLGLIIILTKPQSGILVAIDWFFRQKNRWLFIFLPILWIIISLLVWRNWPMKLLQNVNNNLINSANASLFPWLVPFGIYLIYRIVKFKPPNGELLGTLATICLVPYFAPHSLAIAFTLFSIYYPNYSIITWFLLWIWVFMR